MRNILVFGLIGFFILSCNDDEEVSRDESCVAVSYVEGICGNVVLQIQDERLFYLGETANGYENVFFTTFPCYVDEQTLNKDLFYVSILDESNLGDCIRCLAAIVYSGNKSYHVDVRSNCTE
ncbi:MAG: hypothetical protein AAF149_17210 [Bacteroidota bacterium]